MTCEHTNARPNHDEARPGTRPRRLFTLAAALALGAPLAAAALGPLPHVFSGGDVISARAMNENFEHLHAAIDAAVPPGTVLLFDLPNCPNGFSEIQEARGRALVGLAGSAGTLLGTVGDPLKDLEARTHVHDVAKLRTEDGGDHNHQWWNGGTSYSAGGASQFVGLPLSTAAGTVVALPAFLTLDLFTARSGVHSHAIDPHDTGAANGTLPYVQLLVCRRD